MNLKSFLEQLDIAIEIIRQHGAWEPDIENCAPYTMEEIEEMNLLPDDLLRTLREIKSDFDWLSENPNEFRNGLAHVNHKIMAAFKDGKK